MVWKYKNAILPGDQERKVYPLYFLNMVFDYFKFVQPFLPVTIQLTDI